MKLPPRKLFVWQDLLYILVNLQYSCGTSKQSLIKLVLETYFYIRLINIMHGNCHLKTFKIWFIKFCLLIQLFIVHHSNPTPQNWISENFTNFYWIVIIIFTELIFNYVSLSFSSLKFQSYFTYYMQKKRFTWNN